MKIGDKVLCINDKNYRQLDPVELNLGVKRPKAGEIYTIRGFTKKGTSLMVSEIINPIIGYNHGADVGEAAFWNWRFMKWNPEEVIEEKNYSEIKNGR